MLRRAFVAAFTPIVLVALGFLPAHSQLDRSAIDFATSPVSRSIETMGEQPPGVETVRPPLELDFIARQSAAGLIGGVAGSLMMILPFARGDVGSGSDTRNAAVIAALLGYYTGSVVGVQLYSRHHGVRGSWRWTFGGAAVGGLAGPAFLLTVPVGATIGFNTTRHYPDSPTLSDRPLPPPGG